MCISETMFPSSVLYTDCLNTYLHTNNTYVITYYFKAKPIGYFLIMQLFFIKRHD